MLAWTAVGTIASLAGLLVGLWVLVVARGAKKAAEETKALAQMKNLVEELEHASEKVQQIGIFARSQQAQAVHIRANEVIVACSSVLTRWSDRLGQESRNNLLTARAKVRSIADAVSQSSSPGQSQWRDIAKTNLDITHLVSEALGEARRAEERSDR